MSKIYRISDRIKVKVGDLIAIIGPLTRHQKQEVQTAFMQGKMADGTALAIKYGLKSIEGLETVDGDEYKIKSDKGGLNDSTIDDLFNIPEFNLLSAACISKVNSFDTDFKNKETGEEIDGVSFIEVVSPAKKR